MGYFSNLDITQQECREPSVSPEVEALTARLDYLWELLDVLMYWSKDPEWHEQIFCRDHVTEPYELPNTVQGALDAIAEITQRLEQHRSQVCMYEAWFEAIRKTGATPEGQLVLPRTMFPVNQLQMQAA